jgi:hypothetical protein
MDWIIKYYLKELHLQKAIFSFLLISTGLSAVTCYLYSDGNADKTKGTCILTGFAAHILPATASAFMGKVLQMFGNRHIFLINYSTQDLVLLNWFQRKCSKWCPSALTYARHCHRKYRDIHCSSPSVISCITLLISFTRASRVHGLLLYTFTSSFPTGNN